MDIIKYLEELKKLEADIKEKVISLDNESIKLKDIEYKKAWDKINNHFLEVMNALPENFNITLELGAMKRNPLSEIEYPVRIDFRNNNGGFASYISIRGMNPSDANEEHFSLLPIETLNKCQVMTKRHLGKILKFDLFNECEMEKCQLIINFLVQNWDNINSNIEKEVNEEIKKRLNDQIAIINYKSNMIDSVSKFNNNVC